ncbi:MAG: 50S ribosomal protein L18 [Candidatus Omnitrophica bacterium]|nr:50S ribosomal protein L18 [Candidatus Omnitrophota bacterium]
MKKIGRTHRHKRITKKIKGVEDKPRLVVFRSKKHIYAQIINDEQQRVIAGCSTLSKAFKDKGAKTSDKDAAKEIGKLIAAKALESGVKTVSYDRGGYKYHGRIKSLAQGAREGGLKF